MDEFSDEVAVMKPPPREPERFYAVVMIRDGSTVYCGPKLWAAAIALTVGTCHGQGDDARTALVWAQSAAKRIRETYRDPNWMRKLAAQPSKN